ncbi:LOW QUALITY PROTEIN: hypothetical protein AJ79_00538 [Helicocarpus griseus UAMH5409]|uniref:Uncharacterized protein n=1 Tax=Helicocarpus griseus UAMH5409 TaxID=1447875 RepID=A0A2B7YC40_9EURO|nr:LOW QUALITY PROTEIN: hypothetical protein AJ79_00538 [Helicocarpus griseus UAMH5409]
MERPDARLLVPYCLPSPLPLISPEVIEKLDVPAPRAAKLIKEYQILLNRLAAAIFEDVEIVGNETRETLKRKLSYGNFASRKIYQRHGQLLLVWPTIWQFVHLGGARERGAGSGAAGSGG